jgi:single-strand DNA-binding protein
VASFNQVTIAGNVTREPEVKYLQSGKAVCELGIAINEKRKDQNGQWIEEAVFVDVTFWERTAEVAGEYLHKGSPVLIGGKLKLDTWEKDGKKNSKLRILGQVLQMLGAPGGARSGDSTSQTGPTEDEYPQAEPRQPKRTPMAAAPAGPPPSDDIPF